MARRTLGLQGRLWASVFLGLVEPAGGIESGNTGTDGTNNLDLGRLYSDARYVHRQNVTDYMDKDSQSGICAGNAGGTRQPPEVLQSELFQVITGLQPASFYDVQACRSGFRIRGQRVRA